MKKNILLIFFTLFLTLQGAAQQFEWVRGFAPGENVTTVDSVTDSLGNLYILSSINFNTCWENGSRLLPINPYGHARDIGDALIAKISPDGDLVWHKVIHGNLTASQPHDIKPLGDTAFACLVTMPLASQDFYLYYLDTMIYESERYWDHASPLSELPYPDYPISTHGFDIGTCLALITFDFDGNVLEQHFLNISFLDKYGEDITRVPFPYDIPWYHSYGIMLPSFAIDGDGNIYLSRLINDIVSVGPEAPGEYYDVRDGTISAIKFWCDRRVVGVVPADSVLWYSPQLLKFSPHFDTLQSSRYIFQKKDMTIGSYPHLDIDQEGRLYLKSDLIPGQAGSSQTKGYVTIDSTQNMRSYLDVYKNPWKSIIVRFDSTLTANRLVSLEDSIIDSTNYFGAYYFCDIAFDDDSGLTVVSIWPGRNAWGNPTPNYSYFTFDGEQTTFNINSGIMILDKETMNLKSHGQLNSPYCSRIVQFFMFPDGNLACANNRIFFQSDFSGNIQYPGQFIQTPILNVPGMCLNVFDYKGNMIQGIDYQSYSPENRTGPIQLHDSILYICSQLTTSATFGDIYVPSRGSYFSCIAKYTDPAFAQPYVAIAPIEDAEGAATVYPNPTTDRIRVALPSGEAAAEAYVFDLAGRRQQVPIHGDEVDLSAAPAGLLFLQIVTERHIYNHKIIKL